MSGDHLTNGAERHELDGYGRRCSCGWQARPNALDTPYYRQFEIHKASVSGLSNTVGVKIEGQPAAAPAARCMACHAESLSLDASGLCAPCRIVRDSLKESAAPAAHEIEPVGPNHYRCDCGVEFIGGGWAGRYKHHISSIASAAPAAAESLGAADGLREANERLLIETALRMEAEALSSNHAGPTVEEVKVEFKRQLARAGVALQDDAAALRQELEGLAAFWKAEGKRCYEIAHERPGKMDESVMAQSVRFWNCADELQAILGKHFVSEVKGEFPKICELCGKQIGTRLDLDWHGLGNCAPVCMHCNGSGIEPGAGVPMRPEEKGKA